MPTKDHDSPPRGSAASEENRPETVASIHYIGKKEPKISVPILIVCLVAVSVAIIAFLHFSQT